MVRRVLGLATAAVMLAGCATSTASQSPVTPAVSVIPASSPPAPVSSPSPIPTPTPTPTPAPKSVTITLSGDLLWHNTVLYSAAEDRRSTGKGKEFDFAPMFASIKPVIAGADLSICQSEVPFAKAGGPYTGYPSFSAPQEIAPQMARLGFDFCTTTSNHALDQGFTGLTRTIDVWNAAGIGTEGTYATKKDSLTPSIHTTADGIKVAVVGGTYSLNGYVEPADAPWAVNELDPDEMLASARRAREAGADIVIAHLHAGTEYVVEPNEQQWELAKKLTASPDIDFVYGQHAHVVQPITKVNGKWVVFGVGNLVAQHRTSVPRGHEGIIGRFTFTADADGGFTVDKAEYIPIYMSHYTAGDPLRVVLVNESLKKGTGDRERLLVAKAKTREAVLSLGVKGLTEG